MVRKLKIAYATTPNVILAELFNVSKRSIIRKANELKLVKEVIFKKGYDVKMMVAELYGQRSCQEIADKYKISKRTVIRICKDMNLEMTKEDKRKIISNRVNKSFNSERRRQKFGLNTILDRPIGKSRSRTEAANMLKQHGYLVIKGSMTVYYNDTMERFAEVEENAIANGFRMVLWI